MVLPLPASAARGAAELDAEYYVRALLGVDKDRDIFDKRTPRQEVEPLPSRDIDEVFALAVFSDAARCLKRAGGQWTPPEAIRTSNAATETSKDFYTTAVNVLQSKRERLNFASDLGDTLLERLGRDVLYREKKGLRLGAQTIVDTWVAHGWIDNGSVVRFEDDDDQDDTPRPIQVELKQPVTAPAASQLEQLGIIWHPSFVGLSLASFFREQLGNDSSSASFQEYLLDDTYRTDPRAFRASSTLLMFPIE